MAKTFRRTSRQVTEVFVPRTTKQDRRNTRRGPDKAALQREIEAALVNA